MQPVFYSTPCSVVSAVVYRLVGRRVGQASVNDTVKYASFAPQSKEKALICGVAARLSWKRDRSIYSESRSWKHIDCRRRNNHTIPLGGEVINESFRALLFAR